jgi:hypothetical protein
MHWKSGQEFVRPIYTPLSGPNVHLLEQGDRVSTTPEPGINDSPKIPHKSSVRMLIISTSVVIDAMLFIDAITLYLFTVVLACITHNIHVTLYISIIQFVISLFHCCFNKSNE